MASPRKAVDAYKHEPKLSNVDFSNNFNSSLLKSKILVEVSDLM